MRRRQHRKLDAVHGRHFRIFESCNTKPMNLNKSMTRKKKTTDPLGRLQRTRHRWVTLKPRKENVICVSQTKGIKNLRTQFWATHSDIGDFHASRSSIIHLRISHPSPWSSLHQYCQQMGSSWDIAQCQTSSSMLRRLAKRDSRNKGGEKRRV